jgi:hypothetical protein
VSGNALSYNSSTGVITSAYEESPTFTGTVTSAGLAVDTTTLVVDASNNRVGIGTTGPLAQLEIDPPAVDTPILAIRRQDNATIPLFKFFQDSSISQGTGHAHMNTGNRDLSITTDTNSTKTNGIYLTATDGKAGIGTADTIDGQVHIKGNTNKTLKIDSTFSSGSHTSLAFARNGTDKWRIFQQSDDSHLSFYNEQAGIFDLSLKSNGYVGVGDVNPQHKLKVHLTNGQIAMFGSNNMNSPGSYAGIGLGQVLANGTSHQKVSLVTEGRNSGSYVQDFHILVDTAGDSGSAVLSDSKLKIDGGYGAVTMPSQPAASVRGSGTWSGTLSAAQWIPMQGTPTAYNNQGGHFNTTTKRFTAPVAGYYLCHSSWYIRWSSSTQSIGAQYIHPTHFKNGSSNWANSDQPYQIIGHTLDGGSTAYVDGVERTDIIYCSAGDYLECRFYTYGSHWEVYGNYQHSSYYLLG